MLGESEEGVPQGNVISCTLFSLAINNMLWVIPPGIRSSLYVDDLLIYITGSLQNGLERRLQLAINQLNDWADIHGLNISLLYRSIIMSKIDYGCFIYSTVKPEVPLWLDPIHNLASGRPQWQASMQKPVNHLLSLEDNSFSSNSSSEPSKYQSHSLVGWYD